jgi:hypothetical protein
MIADLNLMKTEKDYEADVSSNQELIGNLIIQDLEKFVNVCVCVP